jgi:hypothetical protein
MVRASVLLVARLRHPSLLLQSLVSLLSGFFVLAGKQTIFVIPQEDLGPADESSEKMANLDTEAKELEAELEENKRRAKRAQAGTLLPPSFPDFGSTLADRRVRRSFVLVRFLTTLERDALTSAPTDDELGERIESFMTEVRSYTSISLPSPFL